MGIVSPYHGQTGRRQTKIFGAGGKYGKGKANSKVRAHNRKQTSDVKTNHLTGEKLEIFSQKYLFSSKFLTQSHEIVCYQLKPVITI